MPWPSTVNFVNVLRGTQVLATGPNGKSETEVERRKASRYRLRVPVLFSGKDTQSKLKGLTRDISTSGVYILCEKDQCPAHGESVTIDLILPSIVDLEAEGMNLRSKGPVVRTDDFPEKCGFAVMADFDMELNTGDQGQPAG
jgi:hypothetical protein